VQPSVVQDELEDKEQWGEVGLRYLSMVGQGAFEE